jgi:hypothetical protein
MVDHPVEFGLGAKNKLCAIFFSIFSKFILREKIKYEQ